MAEKFQQSVEASFANRFRHQQQTPFGEIPHGVNLVAQQTDQQVDRLGRWNVAQSAGTQTAVGFVGIRDTHLQGEHGLRTSISPECVRHQLARLLAGRRVLQKLYQGGNDIRIRGFFCRFNRGRADSQIGTQQLTNQFVHGAVQQIPSLNPGGFWRP